MKLKSVTIGCMVALGGMCVYAADEAPISNGEVLIGVVTDMNGPYASLTGKGSIAAVQMAIDDFGGEVLGQPIKMKYVDHQHKADIAANQIRKWIDVDGVDLV